MTYNGGLHIVKLLRGQYRGKRAHKALCASPRRDFSLMSERDGG